MSGYVDLAGTHDPSTGGIPPAAWGDLVRDNFEWLARNAHSCSLTQSGAQSIPNNTNTDLLWDGEDHDNGALHSTVTNTGRITFVRAGVFIVGVTHSIVGNATGSRAATLLKNGTTVIGGDSKATPPNAGVPARHAVLTVKRFLVADFVIANGFQDSGGARNTVPAEMSMFAIWIRE